MTVNLSFLNYDQAVLITNKQKQSKSVNSKLAIMRKDDMSFDTIPEGVMHGYSMLRSIFGITTSIGGYWLQIGWPNYVLYLQ